MNNFSYSRPATLREAAAQLGNEKAFGRTAILAGGTDLLGEMKDNLASPERLVPIRHLKELQGIRSMNGGLRIGASTLLADIVESPMVQQQTPLLAMAAGKVGTLQIRNMATIGGNLCQRPRCWYYRNNYPCFKHGGNVCYSATGENEYHAILAGGPSYIVHPSDTAPALVALGATVRISTGGRERSVPIEKFFVSPRQDPTRENILQANEILTEIEVPNAPAGSKAVYVKEMVREIWDFALCSVAAVVTVQGGIVRDVRIVLGGVAPIPYRAVKAEAALRGQPLTEAAAAAAGVAATDGARPLAKNAYKVPLTQAVVKRALLALA
ncbi:MAG: xanthine dehydrogenase family protein subunit M [Acidobacteria bacterium]|nr:xanthine dehydrogenase family protein subunit M [Acidobacteriota bacterium]